MDKSFKIDRSLREAIEKANVRKIHRLVDQVKHFSVNDVVKYAVTVGTYEVVEALPTTWYHSDFGCPLLNVAVKRGHEGICRFLLGQELDPNLKDENGYTAMYVACLSKNINKLIIKLLIENGADPDVVTHTGQSVIQLLQRKNKMDVVDIIGSSSTHGTSKIKTDIIDLQDKVYSMSGDIGSINEKLSRLDHLATKEDVHQMATGTYVQFERSLSEESIRSCQRFQPHVQKTGTLSFKRDKDNVYSYLDCDFLEANGNMKRSLSPEEHQHIKSKLTFVIDKLGCNEQIKDIVDRLYEKDALTDEQLEIISKNNRTAKENARFIMINVIIQGGKLHRFHSFIDALADLKEEKMVKVLLTRENSEEETKL